MTHIPIFNHTWPRKFRHRFFFRPMFFPHCRASKWSNLVLWSTLLPHRPDEGIGDLTIHKTIFGPKGLDGWMVSFFKCHLGKKKHVHRSIVDVNVYHQFCISIGIFSCFRLAAGFSITYFHQRNDFTTIHDGRGEPRKA